MNNLTLQDAIKTFRQFPYHLDVFLEWLEYEKNGDIQYISEYINDARHTDIKPKLIAKNGSIAAYERIISSIKRIREEADREEKANLAQRNKLRED